jgi:uncharacterized protein YjlB
MAAPLTSERPRRRALILKGRAEPLGRVPFHADGPLTPWLLASASMDPAANVHVALHEFSGVAPAHREYCQPHVHERDEINVLHTTSQLLVEYTLDGETTLVEAPATVLIPAGVQHCANVRSGSGFMVVVLLDGEYRATTSNA